MVWDINLILIWNGFRTITSYCPEPIKYIRCCYYERLCYADLEKRVDPGNLVPREKLTVVELHANFQQNSCTFAEYQSHLA